MKRIALFWTAVLLLAAPLSAEAKRYSYILDFGEDVLITGKDDIGIRAQCVQNEGGGGYDVVRIYVVTANNSILIGAGNYYPGNGSYLTAVTPAEDAQLSVFYHITGLEIFNSNIDVGSTLNLTTMHGYAISVENTVLGLNSGGNDCIVSVDIKEVKKFKEAL